MKNGVMLTIGSVLFFLVAALIVHGCQQAIRCEQAGNTWYRGACFQKGIIVQP